jgi:hypothetical protein
MSALTATLSVCASMIWLAMTPGLATARIGIQSLKNHSNHDVCLSSLGRRWNGAGVQDETCNGSYNQEWNIEGTDNFSEYNLASIGSSGFCLYQWEPIEDYQLLSVWTCNPWSNNQTFVLYGDGSGGGFTIHPLNNTQYCVSSMGYGNGGAVEAFGCNGSPNQSWGSL